MTIKEKKLKRSLRYARKNNKQICLLPLGNVPAVVVNIEERLWASLISVRPLLTNPFYTRNVKEELLLCQVKFVE